MELTVSIEQFQEELQSWKHELSFIKEEIRQFERNLEKMAVSKLPKDLLAQVEHFQNQFICQKEVIDTLRHDLPDSRRKVENIFQHIRQFRQQDDDGLDSPAEGLEGRMHTFRKIYIGLKQDFYRFEAEWM